MQVILLEKIRNLGTVGDKVSVRRGFGRNYLIPQGKAVFATEANVAKFEARRAELEKAAADLLASAEARAAKFAGFVLTMRAKAADEGKLFGSIGAREIAKALGDAGYQIAKSEILLSEGSIRRVGEHTLNLQLHSDVNVAITLNVVPEEATA